MDELNAVIGEHRVDCERHRFHEGLEEAGCPELRRFAVDPGNSDFRRPIDGDEEKSLFTLTSLFGDVDAEIAGALCLEPFRFLLIGLWQARDAMPLPATIKA